MPTEIEMKEFFQSVVDQVATLSTQAARVEGLEQRINELSERMRSLDEQNAQLQRDLSQSNNTIHELEHKLEGVTQAFDNERAVTANLREVLVSRDSKVQELEQNNQTERDAHKVTLSERDDARQRGDELEQQVSSFRTELEATRKERDDWRMRCHEHETEINDLKSKLDRVNAVLNPLRAISEVA
jgi:chromosome segregation ATPase